MAVRHVYLKIESIPDYSPVCPDPTFAPPIRYGRDCMRNMGHDDGTIPTAEINARTVSALVYREYLDPAYLVPKPDKIVLADINEPPYHRRVPGTVIYARPGDRLKIHVVNADSAPHSFHLHGLQYGIDSDGSWPFGTQSSDGRRSDEICPGQHWTYTFDVTDKMLGAWPFHDHFQNIGANVNRGLLGGLIVLPEHDCDLPPRMKLPPEVEELLRDLRKHLPPEPADQAAGMPAETAGMAMKCRCPCQEEAATKVEATVPYPYARWSSKAGKSIGKNTCIFPACIRVLIPKSLCMFRSSCTTCKGPAGRPLSTAGQSPSTACLKRHSEQKGRSTITAISTPRCRRR